MRVAIALLMVGCAGDVENPIEDRVVSVESVPDPLVPGEKDQGRYLLGDGPDALAGGRPGSHISARGAPTSTPLFPTITRVRAIDGVLHAYTGSPQQGFTEQFSGPDSRFAGMVLATSTPGHRLTITQVLPPHSNPVTGVTSTEYVLDFDSGTASSIKPYCKEGGAMVVSGYWEKNGLHQPDVQSLTFACRDGVIKKCKDWGYNPPDAETSGTETDPWTVHQACTRMARADYCGDGIPHTLEETGIVIRDWYPGAQPNVNDPDPAVPRLVSPATDPAPPDKYWLEAIWRGGSNPALCLFKERWKSLPFGGHCPGRLADPRTVNVASFCEDLHDDELSTEILRNASKVGQLTLNRWSKGIDELLTVRGVAATNGKVDPPFPGYAYVEQVGLLMRNPPGSLTVSGQPGDPADLLPVYLQTRVATSTTPGDRVVSFVDGDTAGYLYNPTSSFEGYVYVANDSGLYQELNLYRNGTDLVTASVQPDGYSQVKPLGFIDPLVPASP